MTQSSRAISAFVIVYSALNCTVLEISPLIATALSDKYALTHSQIGWIFSVEMAATSLASVPALWWLKRFSPRTSVFVSSIVFGIGNVLSGYTSSFEMLMVFRGLTSVASGSMIIVIFTMAASHERPGRQMGFFVLSPLLIGTIALQICPYVISHFGLEAVYLILAVGVLPCLLTVSSLPSDAPCSEEDEDTSFPLQPENPLNSLSAVLAALGIVMFYISISTVWAFTGEIARDAGIPDQTAATAMAIATFTAIIGAVAATIWARENLLSWLSPVGHGILIVGILLLCTGSSAGTFLVAIAAVRFAWNFTFPVILGLVAMLRLGPRFMGVVNFLIGTSLAIGSFIGGWLIHGTDHRLQLFFAASAGLVSLLLFVVVGQRLARLLDNGEISPTADTAVLT